MWTSVQLSCAVTADGTAVQLLETACSVVAVLPAVPVPVPVSRPSCFQLSTAGDAVRYLPAAAADRHIIVIIIIAAIPGSVTSYGDVISAELIHSGAGCRDKQ